MQDIVVNASGVVFAATRYGMVKSGDGGTNWTFSHQPNNGYANLVADLEIGSDGVLYAAYGAAPDNNKLYKSLDSGSNWVNITPPGATGQRTEIALAPSTSGNGQVIYLAIAYYPPAPISNKKIFVFL